MMPLGIDPGSMALERPGDPDREFGRLEKLAGEFEAIFLRQLLKEMKASSAGSLGDPKEGGGSSGSDVFEQMGVDSMAQALVEGGGFGLRDVLIDRLGPHVRATGGDQVSTAKAHDAMTGDTR